MHPPLVTATMSFKLRQLWTPWGSQQVMQSAWKVDEWWSQESQWELSISVSNFMTLAPSRYHEQMALQV